MAGDFHGLGEGICSPLITCNLGTHLAQRDWHCIAEQPAPAPHLAHPEGHAALGIVLVTVPCISHISHRGSSTRDASRTGGRILWACNLSGQRKEGLVTCLWLNWDVFCRESVLSTQGGGVRVRRDLIPASVMNTIPPLGIGAVSLNSVTKAPIPYKKS